MNPYSLVVVPPLVGLFTLTFTLTATPTPSRAQERVVPREPDTPVGIICSDRLRPGELRELTASLVPPRTRIVEIDSVGCLVIPNLDVRSVGRVQRIIADLESRSIDRRQTAAPPPPPRARDDRPARR